MSLLLDALKKAADDKNKKQLDPETAGPIDDANANNAETVSESLELELDLDSDVEVTETATSNDDEFPEVDESALLISETELDDDEKAPTAQAEKIPAETIEVEDNIDDSVLELVDEPALQAARNNIQAPNNTPDVSKTSKNESDLSSENKPEKEKPEDNLELEKQEKTSEKIENEQALSALINKSNQYSRREELKKNITIAILVTLILIGSGLYFFIEMQSSSQNLYIAQNNNAAVNRNTEPKKATSPLKTNPEVTTQKPTNTITPTKPKQTYKSVITKPKITHETSSAPKTINIIHNKRADPVHVLIRQAYDAFHNKNYRTSEKLYKKALLREPKNRDALLGLAAIATKENRFESARQKYQYLLKLNPRDSIAIAGISALENQVDPSLSESQLKFMIKQQPDSAHLYFALGSQYAIQDKWGEAQSAFFSAWSSENENADYAYDLAVSLDHLDKKKQALEFYQLSLKLKQASGGNFSQSNTEKRIRLLQKVNE